MKKKWTKEEDEVIRKYFGKIPIIDICQKINRTHSSVGYRARRIGCHPYIRGLLERGKNRHYRINMTFFDNLNLLNCYWAGFIAADGCIKSKRREVVIAIQKRDRLHLKQFAKDCDYNGPIKSIKGRVSTAINGRSINSGPSVRLEFYGVDQWIKSLKTNFNIIDRKSLVLEPPNIIDDKLAFAYIAGYLDGDGYIAYNKKRNTISFGLRGTEKVLKWIKEILDKEEPYSNYLIGREPKVQNYTGHPVYVISGKRSLKILSKIQKLNLPKLKRKWDKIKEIK